MKPLLSLLFSFSVALSSFGQNGVYLFGFMENAPAETVPVNVLVLSDSLAMNTTLFTNPSGSIPVQWVDLPMDFEIFWISASFINCYGIYQQQTWGANEFDNLIDIPIFLNYCQDTLVSGCTDPIALNYNPNAFIDDGLCQYASNCDQNDIEVTINSSFWAEEISWNLITDSVSVANGGNYQNTSSTVSNHCVPDGCYILELHDSWGDGWHGATIEVAHNGNTIASGTLTQGSFGILAFGINQEDCMEIIYGCTDSLSLSFNPLANIDDGTCAYPITNDICEDAHPILPGLISVDNTTAVTNVGIWGECWGFGQGEGEQSSVWYSFTTPDHPASIHLEALYDGTGTLTDTQFGLFEECGGEMIYCDGNSGQGLMSAFSFECGELAQNTTYILMIDGWMGDAGTCLLQYSVGTACTDTIYGCTDPGSYNYNPNANIDDGSCQDECDLNVVQVLIDVGSWLSEISWNLFNSDSIVVASGSGYNTTTDSISLWCLPDGCYSFMMYEYYGNGWNDPSFHISVNGQSTVSGAMNNGYFGSLDFGINQEDCVYTSPIYGCTDPESLNYNPAATEDDGSCEYWIDCDLNIIMIDISTVIWANEISWNLKDGDNMVVASGSGYSNYENSVTQWCLPDGCYTFEMFDAYGDGWNGATFQIHADGDSLVTGTLNYGNYGSVTFGVNQTDCENTNPIIFGCTDPEALNYNPDATESDDSCIYETTCTEVLIQLSQNIDPDAYWILTSDNAYVNSDSIVETGLTIFECLEDGCYTISYVSSDTINSATYTVYDNNQIIASGTFNNLQQANFVIGEGCESTSDVYGCTDPTALNYNPDATIDDGSCAYPFGCSIEFFVMPDSTGENIIWILPSVNILEAVSVLWEFGDGTTSTELFPQHEYSTEGPYTLCVTATFASPDNSTCSITYCATLSGITVGGSGFVESDSGFSINVINNQTAVGIDKVEKLSNLKLWPNPSTDRLTIQYFTSVNTTQAITILDITGKVIIQEQYESGVGETTKYIDVTNVPSGVYLIKLTAADHIEARRFVIAK